MGEYSKKIGDIGENIVKNFLELIGWDNIQRNFDIPSIDPEKHKKTTHGIDGYFHYRSPMITNTLENILISSKYSVNPYPNSPVTKFKEYYTDLGIAVESFKKSELRVSTMNSYNKIESVFDRGVIFWLNNDLNADKQLTFKLAKIEVPQNISHDGIILVDNNRAEFIYDSLMYLKLKYPNWEFQFVYFSTGFNNDDTTATSGRILPVQFITTSILPLKVCDPQTGEVTFILSTIENFNQMELIKIMGLAKNIGRNFQNKTVIAFPDYSEIEHAQQVTSIKQTFEEDSFTKNLTIVNFNSSFRN